jgi:hypothetical protein
MCGKRAEENKIAGQGNCDRKRNSKKTLTITSSSVRTPL